MTSSPALFILLPGEIFLSKLAPSVPNNILRNFELFY